MTPYTRFRHTTSRVKEGIPLVRLSSFDTSTELGRSSERYRRLLLSGMASVLSKAAVLCTTLISVPLALNYLGTERYGVWMTIITITTMLGFADLGVGNGLTVALAQARGRNETAGMRRLVASGFFVLLAICLVALAGFFAIYPYVSWAHVLNVRGDGATREAGPAVLVVVTALLLNLPAGVGARIQMAHQEIFLLTFCTTAGTVVGLAGLILAIHLNAGLPGLLFGVSFAPLTASAVNTILQFRYFRRSLAVRFKDFDWSLGMRLVRTGGWFLLHQACALIGLVSDNVVISRVLGNAEVTNYAVVQKIFSVVLIVQFFIDPLWPAFSEAIARRDYRWARRTLNNAIRLGLGTALCAAVPLMLLSANIVSRFFPTVQRPSLALTSGFAAWVVLVVFVNTMNVFLNRGSVLSRHVAIFGAASCVALFLKLVLIRHWGLAGVVWATVIAYGLIHAGPALRLAYRHLNELERNVDPETIHA